MTGRRVLMIYCHPLDDSFTGAVRDQFVEGLQGTPHQLRVTDLYADNFEPRLSLDEHVHHLADPATKPGIARYAADLAWCDTLVLIYPTWWGSQPAMLKGWIDRVWVSGVAFELPQGAAHLRPLLTNITRVVVITTHGSSKLINALQGEPGKRVATRSLRAMCARRCRTTWLAMYRIDVRPIAARQRFLARVRRYAQRL